MATTSKLKIYDGSAWGNEVDFAVKAENVKGGTLPSDVEIDSTTLNNQLKTATIPANKLNGTIADKNLKDMTVTSEAVFTIQANVDSSMTTLLSGADDKGRVNKNKSIKVTVSPENITIGDQNLVGWIGEIGKLKAADETMKNDINSLNGKTVDSMLHVVNTIESGKIKEYLANGREVDNVSLQNGHYYFVIEG